MAGSPAATGRTLSRTVAVAALAVVLVGLAVLALLQTIALRHQRAARAGGADTRPAAVVAAIGAASNEVVTLLTVQHAIGDCRSQAASGWFDRSVP